MVVELTWFFLCLYFLHCFFLISSFNIKLLGLELYDFFRYSFCWVIPNHVNQVNRVNSTFFPVFFIDLTSVFLKVFFFISDLHRGWQICQVNQD